MSAKASIWINASMLVLALAWRCDALAAAAPADAGSNQITVHFGDLNVDRPAGAAVLYRRIRAAAQSVCGDRQPPGAHMTSPAWSSCVAQAIDEAVARVDRPAVTAYHRIHSAPSNRKASTTLASSLQTSPAR